MTSPSPTADPIGCTPVTGWTPGPWRIDPGVTNEGVLGADGEFVANCDFDLRTLECVRANAALIAEAGTVATDTGLTPRQLADALAEARAQRDELLPFARALEKECLRQIAADRKSGDDEGAKLKTITCNMVRAAIARAEAGGGAHDALS